MKKFATFLVALLIVFLYSVPASAELPLVEGMWEIKDRGIYYSNDGQQKLRQTWYWTLTMIDGDTFAIVDEDGDVGYGKIIYGKFITIVMGELPGAPPWANVWVGKIRTARVIAGSFCHGSHYDFDVESPDAGSGQFTAKAIEF